MHSHLCDCGNEWSHDEDDILSEEQNQLAHTCSACSVKMWWKKGKCPPPHMRKEVEAELERMQRAELFLQFISGVLNGAR